MIAILSLLTLVHLGRLHTWGTYATETDFYQHYAPDAERIAAWQMPNNTYQGPGYPAALALLTGLTGDVFTSAKWLSMVSAALVGHVEIRRGSGRHARTLISNDHRASFRPLNRCKGGRR